jgi:SpoVK/Ycf46/Vps4 family AAA+-type ATPase
MMLTEQLIDYVHAAFSGIYVVTQEADEAEGEIAALCREKEWKLAVWDVASGLRVLSQPGTFRGDVQPGDPLAVLRAVPALADHDGTALVLLHNYNRFFGNPEVVQTAFTQLVAGKRQRTFLVVLAPVVQVPVELEKLFVVIEHQLPDRAQREEIARGVTAENPDEMPDGDELQRVLDDAAGLPRYEAEGAFALSLTRHNALRPGSIWELKAQALKKNNLLTLHRGGERFDDLGGLSNLNQFCARALRPGRGVKPRGVLLLSPPGCGKSAFCKALGNETSRPTLLLDVGALMGSLVGQTEQNARQALKVADAMSPSALFCDEIEKALSGVGSSGDSGVATRLFGTMLSWLSDHTLDVFFVATANDISKLPPEFARAERFDGVFFLDLPTGDEKNAIWDMYRRQYGIPESQARPDDTSWTGAEIKSCCRLAALLDVPLTQAAHNVVPVAVTAAEQVERLRAWASGRCLSASAPGVYRREGEAAPKSSRRVQRGGNNN